MLRLGFAFGRELPTVQRLHRLHFRLLGVLTKVSQRELIWIRRFGGRKATHYMCISTPATGSHVVWRASYPVSGAFYANKNAWWHSTCSILFQLKQQRGACNGVAWKQTVPWPDRQHWTARDSQTSYRAMTCHSRLSSFQLRTGSPGLIVWPNSTMYLQHIVIIRGRDFNHNLTKHKKKRPARVS